MKPGNLLIQGAKSGVRRKMRVRIAKRSESSERLFLLQTSCTRSFWKGTGEKQKGIERLWKKDSLLQNV